MKSTIIIIWVLGLWFSGLAVSAQNFEEDIKLSTERYSNINNFYSEMTVKVFASGGSSLVYDLDAVIKKQGDNYLYSIPKLMTMLVNETCMVTLIPDNLEMTYQDWQDKKPDYHSVMTQDFDSIARNYDSVYYAGLQENGDKKYVIYAFNQLIHQTELHLSRNGYISFIKYHYNPQLWADNQVVTIDFVNTDLTPVFTNADFSEYQFVQKSNGQIVPSNPYKAYSLTLIEP